MAELAPGEKSWEKMLKPQGDEYTLTAIRDHLCVSTADVRKLCRSLNIELGPYVRDEPMVKKTYKHKKRWLTEDEARAIISLHWARRGR